MATTASEYAAWVKDYAGRFGFSDADTSLLTRWYPVLRAYDPAQLDDAAERLLRGDYPRFARDHLKALLPLLRELEARSLRARDRNARQDDRGTCVDCGGSGWVSDLPHPKSVAEGQWLWPCYTCAVFCLCGLGRWRQQNWPGAEGLPVPLDLLAYDALNPKWQAQRQQRAVQQRAEAGALDALVLHGAAEVGLREHLDAVLGRLARRYHLSTE